MPRIGFPTTDFRSPYEQLPLGLSAVRIDRSDT